MGLKKKKNQRKKVKKIRKHGEYHWAMLLDGIDQRKKKDGEDSDDDDNENDDGNNTKNKNNKRTKPKKPAEIQLNGSNGSRWKRNKNNPSDELLMMKTKISAKTKKRNARHSRNETPQYDIQTKDFLAQEYEKTYFSGSDEDENAVANGVLSEDGDDTPSPNPKAPPKGYRSYRKQKVEFDVKKKEEVMSKKKRNGDKVNTRGFRKRGDGGLVIHDDYDKEVDDKKRGKKTEDVFPKKVQKDNKMKDGKLGTKKKGKREQMMDEKSGSDSTESEYETDTESDSEYESGSTETDSEYTTDSDSSSGSTESDSEDESDSEYETG